MTITSDLLGTMAGRMKRMIDDLRDDLQYTSEKPDDMCAYAIRDQFMFLAVHIENVKKELARLEIEFDRKYQAGKKQKPKKLRKPRKEPERLGAAG